MSPLAKVPMVLIVTVAFHICYYQPNPPAPTDRRHNKYNFSIWQYGALKLMLWSLGIMEMAAILREQHETMDLYLSPASVLGATMIMAAALIRKSCYAAMGRMFTLEVSILEDHKLIKDGPYGVVRHPSYTGSFLVAIGEVLWFFTPGSFIRESTAWTTRAMGVLLCYTFIRAFTFLLPRMTEEDGLLRKQFGKEWDEWARKVPYKLIPYVY